MSADRHANRSHRSALTAASVLWLVVFTLACGGGSDNSGSPTSPTVPARTPRVIAQGGFSLNAPTDDGVFFGLVHVTDAATGNWEASVDWTFATNTLFMYVTTAQCSAEQFASPDCPDSPACPC